MPPLPPLLKQLLACPKCHGELKLVDSPEELQCLQCRLAYRIEDDIPVMLAEEARKLGEPGPAGDAP